MIYLIQRETGAYDDYRVDSLSYTTDLQRATEWAEKATKAAGKLDKKRDQLKCKMNEIRYDDAKTEKWNELYKQTEALRTSYDKTLDSYYLGTVVYAVREVEEL